MNLRKNLQLFLNKKYIKLFIDDPDDGPSPKLIDQKQQSAFLFTFGQYGGKTTHQLIFTLSGNTTTK